MKKFYKMFLVCTLIFSFMLFPSVSQCQWGFPIYGGYYNYYGQPQNPWAGIPYDLYGMYGQPRYNQPYNYGTPYGYGNQPYNYGGYYQPQSYGYGGWGQPYNYGGYNTYNSPYRYTNYNQPPLGGYYTPYSPIGGYSYSNYYGSSTLPSKYTDADVEIDEGDNGDDITVDKGDTIVVALPSIIVPGSGGYEWGLDSDDLDEDIVDKKDDIYFNGHQYWLFEAEETGTTTIKMGNYSWINTSSIGEDTFEVEITVKD